MPSWVADGRRHRGAVWIGWARAVEDRYFGLRIGLWLAGAIGVAASAGMYAVSVLIAGLSFAILYGLRQRPYQRTEGHRRGEDSRKVPKEVES